MISDNIKSALTADEWAKRDVELEHEHGGRTFVTLDEDRHARVLQCGYISKDNPLDYSSAEIAADSPLLPKLIALANDLLPNGDAAKVTAALIFDLRGLLAQVDELPDTSHTEGAETTHWRSALAGIHALRTFVDALERRFIPPTRARREAANDGRANSIQLTAKVHTRSGTVSIDKNSIESFVDQWNVECADDHGLPRLKVVDDDPPTKSRDYQVLRQ